MVNGKKLVSVLLVLGMLVLLLPSCSPSAGNSSGAGTTTQAGAKTASTAQSTFAPGTTIKMWTFLNPDTGTDGRSKALAQMIASFKQETGVTVVVEPQDWKTLGSKFLAAAASGTAPDIIWNNIDSDLGAVIKMGYLEPLENLFLSSWTKDQLDDAASVWFDLGVDQNGKHYQLSFSRNFNGIVYRTDVFKEAGISMPFKSWDEFRAAAKTLTIEKDSITGTKRYGFGTSLATSGSDPVLTTAMIIDANGSLFNADGTAAWSNEVGVRGSNLIKDMMLIDKTIPDSCLTQSVDDLYKDFCSGKYGMIAGAAVRIPSIQASCVFDPETVAIVPFPGEKNVYSKTVLTGWGVGVWTGGKNKEAAGKFLEYMFTPESDKLWVQIGGQLPMLKSTFDSMAADLSKDPKMTYIVDSVKYMEEAGWPVPSNISIADYRNDFTGALQDIIVNGTDTLTALQKAEKAFNNRNVD